MYRRMAERTPLYDAHVAAGAKMVDFHGWDMPLHYGSQLGGEAVDHGVGDRRGNRRGRRWHRADRIPVRAHGSRLVAGGNA